MTIYFYILLLMFGTYLFVSFKKNIIFRPVIIYGFSMFLYPIVSNLIYIYDLLFLYPWHPLYDEVDYVKAIEISICALLPINFVPFFIHRQTDSIRISGRLTHFFLIHILFRIVLIGILFYALFNYRQFFQTAYNELEIFSIITLFDYVLFSVLLIWQSFFPQQKFNNLDKFLFGLYILLKVVSGGRMFLVVFVLLFGVKFIQRSGFRLNSLKLFLLGAPLAVIALGSIVVIRDRTMNFLLSFYQLSIEYVNATFSSLKVAQISDNIGMNLGMLVDPLISLVPSSILSREYFTFFKFINLHGGAEEMAPIGGSYLPHQVFLIIPSLVWMVFYFALWSAFLVLIDRIIFTKKGIVSGYKYAILLGCQSLLLVFSVRHYFFVHLKTLLIVLIVVFIYYFIFQIIIKFLLKKDFSSFITIKNDEDIVSTQN